MQGAERMPTGRRRRVTIANLPVVAQVACSLVLLVAAGLFCRSIAGASGADPGFATGHRTAVSFDPSLLRYDAARTAVFYRTLLARLRQAPEIGNGAFAQWLPLGFFGEDGNFLVEGRKLRGDRGQFACFVNVVTPGYVETMRVPIRSGRNFADQDTAPTLPVAIVNETFAKRAWPGLDPIGRQLRSDTTNAPWLTVVGVMADHKYRGLDEPPRPYVLRPLAQRPTDGLTLLAADRRDHASSLAAIRREVRALDPGMPMMDVKTMEQQIAFVRFEPQAMTAMAGPGAALAMLIAAIGLYGVIAYSVSRRTREFGIRLAIGAQPGHVTGQVMSQGVVTVVAGLVLGAFAAVAVAQVMRGVLIGVAPTDPAVFLGATSLLVVVSFVAMYLPARRASRIDPIAALRTE